MSFAVKHVWYLCREAPLLPAKGGKEPQPAPYVVHLYERTKVGDSPDVIARCGKKVTLITLPSMISGGCMLACLACLGLSEVPVDRGTGEVAK